MYVYIYIYICIYIYLYTHIDSGFPASDLRHMGLVVTRAAGVQTEIPGPMLVPAPLCDRHAAFCVFVFQGVGGLSPGGRGFRPKRDASLDTFPNEREREGEREREEREGGREEMRLRGREGEREGERDSERERERESE